MLTHLRASLVMLLMFTALTGIAYPLAIAGSLQIVAPSAANGSLVVRNGAIVGSELIGQSFTSERYFHGRPSATTAPDPKDDSKTVDRPYNAGNSAGSNLGPLSKKLLERIAGDVSELKKEGAGVIPADAVTTSASGLDPHISPAFAALQIARVAAARGVSADRVREVVDRMTEYPMAGFLGVPRVNVLRLNLALDAGLVTGAG